MPEVLKISVFMVLFFCICGKSHAQYHEDSIGFNQFIRGSKVYELPAPEAKKEKKKNRKKKPKKKVTVIEYRTVYVVQQERLPEQQTDNYDYDPIGNLIKDEKEGITNIEWTVYGKIKAIYKKNGMGGEYLAIQYSYDDDGNRIQKTVYPPDRGVATTTIYVRDASGNVMSVYTQIPPSGGGGAELTQTEAHLYGSSRLGIMKLNRNVENPVTNTTSVYSFVRGNKQYELSNHLGNVLVVITDRKLQVADAGNATLIAYYTADVVSATDYYPFGMGMPGRSYSSDGYRYGFNGKEKDKDMHSLTAYDYGFRIYNPAIGRFLSVDPLSKSYPWYTPYQFAGNKPIIAIDLDGLEEYEVFTVAQHLYNTELQNQAKEVAKIDNASLLAMQRTAWNAVISDLDAIVAKHFDPIHNAALTETQWSGITGDVSNYFWNASSGSSLAVWNSYMNYDFDGASTDEIQLIIDGTVEDLVNNHFYSSSAGTEFYYRYINAVNEAKDPNKKAALISERETISKARWSSIMNSAGLGFANLFLAGVGLNRMGSGSIGGRTFRIGYYASEESYFLLERLGGGYSPVYRAAPKEGELMALKAGEYQIKPNATIPVRGLSLNTSVSEASSLGEVYRIKSIPAELMMIKTPSGRFPGHIDLIPRNANMSEARFQELLNQVTYEIVK